MTETSQPKPDTSTTTSPDVPSSTDPQDIKDGLAQNPELSKIEILQNKAVLLSDAIKKHDAEGAKFTPDQVDEIELHAKVREKLAGQMRDLSKEIQDHAKASGKSGPAGKTLHFPILDKAWDALMNILKALLDLFMKGARFLRNLIPNAPGKNGADPAPGKAAPREKTTIGLNLPGGPVAVRPPEVKDVKPATPDEVQDAGEQALEAGATRQKDIKTALAAEAENANDSDGPAPGSTNRKPK